MIQIMGLRPYKDQKTGKTKLKHKLFANYPDIAHCFKNIDTIIQDIPEAERWNIFYTTANCQDPSEGLRRFKSQEIVPFDLDNIQGDKLEQYLDIFFRVTALDRASSFTICSGNGLQIIIQLHEAFRDVGYFKESRNFYKGICNKVNKALEAEGLPGDCDPSVWSGARILRFPNTENRKPKGVTKSYVIDNNLKPQRFVWEDIIEIPKVADKDCIEWDNRKQIKLDIPSIKSDCQFIKWAFQNPGEVREPSYYAISSILSRTEPGRKACKDLQKRIAASGSDSSVASWDESEVDEKIKQSLEAAGPRKCENINSIASKCEGCEVKGRVVSPISIKGKSFIATEETGFHTHTAKGKPIPNHEDLLKYFDKQHYHVTNEGGNIYIFKDNYFQSITPNQVKGFAEEKFDPSPMENVRIEFLKKVQSTNIIDAKDFFNKKGYINFNNGVLRIKTQELLPHSPEYGFQYILDYDYDPKADCPNFNAYIDSFTSRDSIKRSALLEYMGYILANEGCWAQKCLVLLGEGANGKSTFTDILMAMVGEENASAVGIKGLQQETQRSSLEGKLLNVSEEIPQGRYFESSDTKAMIAGGKVSARKLYHNMYILKNNAKFVFACNELPKTQDTTKGFFRRLLLVSCDANYDDGTADRDILSKILPELPGIFNMAMENYKNLKDRSYFQDIESSKQILSDYRNESDPIRYFIEESGKLEVKELNGRKDFATLQGIYDEYCESAEYDSRVKPESRKVFTRKFFQILDPKRLRMSNRRVNGKTFRCIDDVVIHTD